ncbi:CAP domain-containing protein [Alteribacillus sp. JSM 102045]|uniref:CAP domain-containing protein n=1 Tax=Alteribacillus sp. JSM 102045 TaxID=1562101 RepID=UPI0035C26D23
MSKKVFMLLSCILLITIMTGCNTDNQGAADHRNNDYEQIDYTPDNVENEQNNRFPLNLFPDDAEEGDGNAPMLPVPNPDLEIEEGAEPDQEAPGAEEFDMPEMPEEEPVEDEEESKEAPEQEQETQQGDEGSDAEQQVIELTNQEREKNGLSPLEADSQVAEAAQAKSEDMAENNYFAHNSPTYGSPFNMLNDFGVDYTAAAENIAAGQQTPEEVVQAWMNSEGHRKNILNEEVTHIGVGYVEDGNHWTQLFIGK